MSAERTPSKAIIPVRPEARQIDVSRIRNFGNNLFLGVLSVEFAAAPPLTAKQIEAIGTMVSTVAALPTAEAMIFFEARGGRFMAEPAFQPQAAVRPTGYMENPV